MKLQIQRVNYRNRLEERRNNFFSILIQFFAKYLSKQETKFEQLVWYFGATSVEKHKIIYLHLTKFYRDISDSKLSFHNFFDKKASKDYASKDYNWRVISRNIRSLVLLNILN